jgi:hypothetical protein
MILYGSSAHLLALIMNNGLLQVVSCSVKLDSIYLSAIYSIIKTQINKPEITGRISRQNKSYAVLNAAFQRQIIVSSLAMHAVEQ